ncbi:MAG: hypothetical protein KDA84_19215 [Planctomycetaceae bacterium]|nr:hypothetical protein [Planctomycetaceae bacterium]
MIRWFWLGCLISGLSASARAEEYILYLDAVGYIDQPITEKAPKETVLRHIEVLVEPAKPFHVKMQSGKETVTLSGTFAPPEADDATTDFEIHIKYRYQFEKELIETGKGQVKPIFDERSFNTQLGVNLGKRLKAAEFGSEGNRTHSQVKYQLVLNKSNPNIRK